MNEKINSISPEKHERLVNQIKVEEKRKELETTWGGHVLIDYPHIQRHFKGSGVLGASIERWSNTEEMLLDEGVWGFVEESVDKLEKKMKPGKGVIFRKEFDYPVGKTGVTLKESLPEDANVWGDYRNKHKIYVTDSKAPETNTLTIMFIRDKSNHSQIRLLSAWAGDIDTPQSKIDSESEKFVFYDECK